MKRLLSLVFVLGLAANVPSVVVAVVLIGGSTNNGNLDRTHATEVVPGFFLPKPDVWEYAGSRTISGPFQEGLSSEPWAGPAPPPVTTDGNLNPPSPDGCGGPDCAVFFKPFTGNIATGDLANVDLYQDHIAFPGLVYVLSGWAGAESNAMMQATFNIDFLNGGGGVIGRSTLSLTSAGLFVPNGQPFNYKQYTVSAVAPLGTVSVRARVSMIDAQSNPAGGGQAFVVDDFTLMAFHLGDYNQNGVVDAADYVLWRNDPASYGGNPAGYNTWRTNFGQIGGSGVSSVIDSVPEPTCIALFSIAAVMLGGSRFRTQQK